MITSNEQMRLAKMEAMCDHIRSEMSDVLERAYAIAVEERDEDRAAELARKIRNKLLDDSDKYNTVDRVFNFDLPETISTTNVISAVKALIEGINGITASDAEQNGTALYNLAGQRVAKGYKGLVIKNGKKYLVK